MYSTLQCGLRQHVTDATLCYRALAMHPHSYGTQFSRLRCSVHCACHLLVSNLPTEIASHLQWHMDGAQSARPTA